MSGQDERLREALQDAIMHNEELREAWERGVISEHDGKGGTRSNRNLDLLVKMRKALAQPQETAPVAFDAFSALLKQSLRYGIGEHDMVECRFCSQVGHNGVWKDQHGIKHRKDCAYAAACLAMLAGQAVPATATLSEEQVRAVEDSFMQELIRVTEQRGYKQVAKTLRESFESIRQAAPGSAEEWQKVSLPHVMAPDAVTTAVPDAPTAGKGGAELIAAERKRQIEVEGWTAEHDAQHKDYDLQAAGRCYASVGLQYQQNHYPVPSEWPWEPRWWKPSKDKVKNLVRAGALIAAAIDRHLHASSARPRGTSAGEEGES